MANRSLKVALFITCLGDQFYPQVGESVVRIMRRVGAAVTFNPQQTCCGQPAFNTGYREEAREVAARNLDLFDDADYIVAPSGSCSTMFRVFYPELFAEQPDLLMKVERLRQQIGRA